MWDSSFYRGKTVLVTGHTGFKGGWLTVWLKLLGARVVGLSLPPEQQPNLFTAARVADGIVSLIGDVRRQEVVEQVFQQHAPQIVFHLAAQPLVHRSYLEPVTTYATNVLGTVHVLEAARHSPRTRAIVVITTDKCYAVEGDRRACREQDRLGGYDPYSSSKACAELVAQAYRDSFFRERQIGVATARAGNVFGGGDWAEKRLVPDFVRAVTGRRPLLLRRPGAVRPWQHVLEPIGGYLLLAEKLWHDERRLSGPWNFGPDPPSHVTVGDLAGRLVRAWQAGQLLGLQQGDPSFHETDYLALDCRKAKQQLGWRPLLQLDDAVALACHWYRTFYEQPAAAEQVTQDQIHRYIQRAQVSQPQQPPWKLPSDRQAA